MTQDDGSERLTASEQILRTGKGVAPAASNFPPVLDVCCGGRMMWFDKRDLRTLYVDKRRESHKDVRNPGSNGWRKNVRTIDVDPDIIADFTKLPFPSETFFLVVFDPPHIIRLNENPKMGWITRKYGVLLSDWRDKIRLGFEECFRVLRHNGTLIFKWSESHISVSDVLALTPEKPLFGHKSGAQAGTHWIVFLKQTVDMPL